jgi:hypothetical protein
MEALTVGQLFTLFEHFVFWCSVATLFLAAVERSVRKFYPGGRAEKVIGFITDIVSQFGALNLRAQIAPPKWDGVDKRKSEEPPVPPTA